MTATPLRERQSEQVRVAILEAVVAELETKEVDDIVMSGVAEAAAVSLRTLYRYFPDRSALLHAAGEHLYGSLGVPIAIDGPDDVSASFLDAARRLSARPALTRALVQTTAGRAARSSGRGKRVEAIRAALAPLTEGLDPATARWATAAVAHLCSAVSWVTIAEDSGLGDADAQLAAAWAIDTLISALREREAPASHNPRSTP